MGSISRDADTAIITAEGLSYSYQLAQDEAAVEHWALQGIDLQVRPGEFLAVVGPNGSGKSTLAKHLNALLIPVSGRVTVAGLDTGSEEQRWDIRQIVGMVFQNPDNQLVATQVVEDVAFGPENLGLPRQDIATRVDESLRLVGMEQYRDRPPHLLSGGQKQRVAIAGILAMKPRCIVLDEATSMLDPVGREEVMETIRGLNAEQGITVVHITHNMDEAVFADRVAVMSEGRIAMVGSPEEVFARDQELRELGLEVPIMVELAIRLRNAGYPVPRSALTVEAMVDYLCGQ